MRKIIDAKKYIILLKKILFCEVQVFFLFCEKKIADESSQISTPYDKFMKLCVKKERKNEPQRVKWNHKKFMDTNVFSQSPSVLI
jgi:hypothetical protein